MSLRLHLHDRRSIRAIFVNSLHDFHSGIRISDVSDHLQVLCISDYKMNLVDVSKFVVKSQRLINDVSIERFDSALSVIDWSDVLLLTDANVAYNQSISLFVHKVQQP